MTADTTEVHDRDGIAVGTRADVLERREALIRLGAELRALNEALVTTETPVETLDAAAVAVRSVTDRLVERSRGRDQLASVDDLAAGVRLFNPVTGPANPVAPLLRVVDIPNGAVGQVTLGLVHEGHWRHAHGGVLAALLDQVLGHAAEPLAKPTVTTRLALRYRKPVPLQEPLVVKAEVEGMEGRRVTLRGTIALAAEPDVVCVESEAWFVQLGPEHATSMFGSDLRTGSETASR